MYNTSAMIWQIYHHGEGSYRYFLTDFPWVSWRQAGNLNAIKVPLCVTLSSTVTCRILFRKCPTVILQCYCYAERVVGCLSVAETEHARLLPINKAGRKDSRYKVPIIAPIYHLSLPVICKPPSAKKCKGLWSDVRITRSKWLCIDRSGLQKVHTVCALLW